jgi:hypothetical protein
MATSPQWVQTPMEFETALQSPKINLDSLPPDADWQPSLLPIIQQLAADGGAPPKNAESWIVNFISLRLAEEGPSEIRDRWQGLNKIKQGSDGFWDLDWKDRVRSPPLVSQKDGCPLTTVIFQIFVLRITVDHHLTYCKRIRDMIKEHYGAARDKNRTAQPPSYGSMSGC